MIDLIPWRKKTNKSKELVDYNTLMPHHEIESLFDLFFERDPFSMSRHRFSSSDTLQPAIDISDNKKMITVKAELPGMDPKGIDVSLDGRVLTIKGEKRSEEKVANENYFYSELSYGHFSRSVQLPADVDQSSVDASYKKGVLKIKMKKKKAVQGQTIKIKSH